jgi:hypothetical protein
VVIQCRISKGIPEPTRPPPYGTLYGACGAAVDPAGNFYISDYYRHVVDVWQPDAKYASTTKYKPLGEVGYLGQIAEVDPGSGPCALAFDSAGNIYVNGYHHSVSKFGPMPSFGNGSFFPLPGEDTAHHLPTGVSVDPSTGDVYVDHRTYVGVYEEDGTPLMDGLLPKRIGSGTLQDGYGITFSEYPGTYGHLYVADAASDTIEIYDPVLDNANPIDVIDGSDMPEGGFTSLRDSAVAIDRVTGDVYVVDAIQPVHSETPQARIQIFDSTGAYEGHFKFQVSDAFPAGLAVDNSASPTDPEGHQGRVYVTTGNTDLAAIYAYAPGSATTEPSIPAPATILLSTRGSGIVRSDVGRKCSGPCELTVPAGSSVELTADPAPGAAFLEWSGACFGTAPYCVVTSDRAASVRAVFVQLPPTADGSENGPATGSAAGAAAAVVPADHHRRRGKHHRRRRHRRVSRR